MPFLMTEPVALAKGSVATVSNASIIAIDDDTPASGLSLSVTAPLKHGETFLQREICRGKVANR